MKSHSYEIEVARRADGLLNLCIYDAREGKHHIAILDNGFTAPSVMASARVHDLLAALKIDLAGLKPGKTYRF